MQGQATGLLKAFLGRVRRCLTRREFHYKGAEQTLGRCRSRCRSPCLSSEAQVIVRRRVGVINDAVDVCQIESQAVRLFSIFFFFDRLIALESDGIKELYRARGERGNRARASVEGEE